MTDAADPWGRSEPPVVAEVDLAPLPPSLATIAAALESGEQLPAPEGGRSQWPRADDLPEVQELAAAGWAPLSPLELGSDVGLIPAVWPAAHRRWLPDRLPSYGVVSHGDHQSFIEPDTHNPERARWELARLARSVGLPPPPKSRLWLLRSPWPGTRIGSLLLLIRHARDAEGTGWDAVGMMRAAERVLAGTEEQAWARWRGPEADAARAWRGVAQSDPDVDPWVALGFGPDHVETLERELADGGAQLSRRQALAWGEVMAMFGRTPEDAVGRVVAWRKIGLPADAPVWRLASVMFDRQPSDVAPWLEAGITPEDLAVWEAEDLPRALRWRDAGFDSRQARELTIADPTVTPEEALAYDAAGISRRVRARWVATGFSPSDARAWTDLDVVASEARVWRSRGLGPGDARAQRDSGTRGPLPAGFEGGWAAVGPDRDDMNFGVIDPPGTRGQAAAESGDPMWDVPRD
ncbi:hypothetical protein [Terrabacter sp. MAHUQ-38]|uniref:hypothetical protein n=1 Tax=unclassified Terrabacter TaxID=2630222 RepID=UPI00165E3C4D|nr:hypothetical protein [Terrabacter sp. MAHUQ-38]MBC9821306.1 hypothetical protein [Terrabacter sp. MAHUQ-38]